MSMSLSGIMLAGHSILVQSLWWCKIVPYIKNRNDVAIAIIGYIMNCSKIMI